MKKNLPFLFFFLSAFLVQAQTSPNINSWHLNTTGAKASYWTTAGAKVNMTDSSGVTKLAYSSSSIYIKTKGLADNYTMGANKNPFVPAAQSLIFKIPKTPSEETGTKTAVPGGGPIGIAVNGVVIYGSRDADSYKSSTNTNVSNGDGLWHGDAWYNEGATMDTSGGGHSTNAGAYHYHAVPFTLYSDPSTSHSPIIAYALDGYPIYGPFGYSSPMDNASGITRMVSSYKLRSISTRTILPDGSTSSPAGPAVDGTFPLGMYTEDYEYSLGYGDLDEYNGRYCVTPEYPSGIYAYFITTDNNGDPAYPYLLATEYYGATVPSDMGPNVGAATIPSSGVTYVTTVTSVLNKIPAENISVYPNPSSDKVIVELKGSTNFQVTVRNSTGKIVDQSIFDSSMGSFSLNDLKEGLYFLTITDEEGRTQSLSIMKE